MPVVAPGSDWDLHGCIRSGGYMWCEILHKCLRTWEEVCDYPKNCLTWNDGCNTCQLIDGEIGACTEMACFRMSTPYCLVQSPDAEVGIEPWLMKPQIDPMPVIDPMPMPMPIDSMPPVINPFLGDGH